MVFFVVFLGGTIFFFVGPEAIFGADCTTGSKTTLVDDLYATSDEAYKKFCTDECPCKLDPASDLYGVLSQVSDPALSLDGNHSRFSECVNDTKVNSTAENIDVLAAIEDLLQCGGWCSFGNPAEDNPTVRTDNQTYFKRFVDINNCNTEGNYLAMKNVTLGYKTVMTLLKIS